MKRNLHAPLHLSVCFNYLIIPIIVTYLPLIHEYFTSVTSKKHRYFICFDILSE